MVYAHGSHCGPLHPVNTIQTRAYFPRGLSFYICIDAYRYIYIYICIYIHMYVCMYACLSVCSYMYMSMYVYMHMYMYMYVYIYVCVYVYVKTKYVNIYVYIYTQSIPLWSQVPKDHPHYGFGGACSKVLVYMDPRPSVAPKP